MNENLYEILGLNKNATAEEIKASYRRLAMLYHPDKNKGDKEKEEKFKKISFAYDTLGDTTKKQQYDTQSPHGKTYQPNPFGAFGGGVDDIFNTFFGGNPFGGGGPFGGFHQQTHFHQEFNENLDITVNVVITLTDVYKAKPIKVSYKRYQHCDDCQGTGFDRNSHSDTCEMCGGGGRDQFGRQCQYCQGHGKIYTGTCKSCNGEKVVLKDVEFHINDVRTLRQSTEKYLRDFGHQSKYYRDKKGVLRLNIIYQHIPNYTIENEQLIYNLDIHYQDAIDGIKYEYECLDGTKLNVDIPQKSNNGDLLRLSGKGLFKNLSERDDLFFRMNIVINYERLK